MNVREAPPQPAPPHREQPKPQKDGEPPPYPAEKARGGEIILRKRWQKIVFIGALVAAFLIALGARIVAGFYQ